MLPSSWESAGVAVTQEIYGLMLVTLEPNRVSPSILYSIDVVIGIGENPQDTLRIFAETVGVAPPHVDPVTLNPGEALAWFRRMSLEPVWFRSITPRSERRRHRRKYAEGELGPDLCFYFRGPQGKLNLKAQNLSVFLQIAEGVDDDTWLHHLRQGDYAKWFKSVIKDPELAAEAESLCHADVTAGEGRKRLRHEIEQRYILAA